MVQGEDDGALFANNHAHEAYCNETASVWAQGFKESVKEYAGGLDVTHAPHRALSVVEQTPLLLLLLLL